MVAFSGVLMANTIKIKEVALVTELKSFKIQADLKEEVDSFTDEFERTYQDLIEFGNGHEFARVAFNRIIA